MNSKALGKVFLVGAGPGDPELLTLKAYRLLGEADVVVYDRLVHASIMNLIPSRTPRVFVGKYPGRHHTPQAQINDILVELAQTHGTVVRLKGGDPFIFGRGGEEALELVAAGIEVVVVPGITAAAGCGASVGLPLTHRGYATSVRFVTGHCRAGKPLNLDWPSLVSEGTTLVFYMGLANLDEIRTNLTRHGMSVRTPVAAVENGSTPEQRVHFSTLERVKNELAELSFRSPTLLVVGAVVRVAERLAPHMVAKPLQEASHAHLG
ncbi:Uroporphyrinogen-III C-methyltransferase [Sulfidibacter corallicola]|uniref:uroporphyrinogen-III C-methyltransferase n=1 Tax=Sulfidibacter corallicola TaxID=2818388 RepID=A0A8A4TMF2_SULCO|nr:uroporphyrinogen-III C-methyltransferase [Sulfidibacter corallicola]QTD50384.1 uroporphyrinogen-III C-methyltransferase [Sulfidibacter corallicola]